MALGKTVYFKKLTAGSVGLYMNDVEGVLAPRWFSMDQKMPRIGIPVNYALTLFTDLSIEAMFKNNYFEVENMDELIKVAEEKGYIAPSKEEVEVLTTPKRSNETLLAILKGGNEKKIRELFASADKERALEVAQDKIKDLSLDVIAKVEEVLGMAISEE